MQHPLMSVVSDAASVARFTKGREAADLAVVRGYEVALSELHPDDVEERAYYQERLRDARCAAGLAPVEPLPRADVLRDARSV